MLVSVHLSHGLSFGISFSIFIHSLAGFFAGFMYGWLVHRYFLGLRGWKMALWGGVALTFHIYTATKIVWFSPEADEVARVFNLSLFIPLVHSSLAVLYYILSRKTVVPTHPGPYLEEGQKRLHK